MQVINDCDDKCESFFAIPLLCQFRLVIMCRNASDDKSILIRIFTMTRFKCGFIHPMQWAIALPSTITSALHIHQGEKVATVGGKEPPQGPPETFPGGTPGARAF